MRSGGHNFFVARSRTNTRTQSQKTEAGRKNALPSIDRDGVERGGHGTETCDTEGQEAPQRRQDFPRSRTPSRTGRDGSVYISWGLCRFTRRSSSAIWRNLATSNEFNDRSSFFARIFNAVWISGGSRTIRPTIFGSLCFFAIDHLKRRILTLL